MTQDILDRAERLVPKFQNSNELRAGAGEITRAVILRLALLRGLDELEKSLKAK